MRKCVLYFKKYPWGISLSFILALISAIIISRGTTYVSANISIDSEEDTVWIAQIYIDEEAISLSEFSLANGWEYHEEWDDIISRSNERETLQITLPSAQSAEICFISSEPSKINIEQDGIKIREFYIHEDFQEQNDVYFFKINTKISLFENYSIQYLFLFSAIFLLFISVFYTLKNFFIPLFKNWHPINFCANNKVSIGVSTIVVMLLLCTRINTTYKSKTIVIEQSPSASVIWLAQVIIDGRSVSLAEFPLTDGWEYQDEWDDIISYSTSRAPLLLHFDSSENIELYFVSAQPNTIHITDGDSLTANKLFSKYGYEPGTYFYKVVPIKSNSLMDSPINFIIPGIILEAVFLIHIFLMKRNHRWVISLLALISIIGIVFNDRINLHFSLLLLFQAGIVYSGYYLLYIPKHESMQLFLRPFSVAVLLLVTAIFSFCLVGHDLFLSEDIITFTVSGISTYIVSVLLCSCIVYTIVYRLDQFACDSKMKVPQNLTAIRLAIGLANLVPLLIISFGYYPANLEGDGVTSWMAAMGEARITDDVPVFFTLLLRGLLKIWPNPYMLILLHITLYSILISQYLTHCYKNGAPLTIVFLVSLSCALLPNMYLTLTQFSKNVSFSLAVLWFNYELIKLFENPRKYFDNIYGILKFSLSSLFVYTMRPNGFVIVVVIGILLIHLIRLYWKVCKRELLRPVLSVILMLTAVFIINNPLSATFNVAETQTLSTFHLISPMGIALINDLYLPEEIEEYLVSIAPKEAWQKNRGSKYATFLGLKRKISRQLYGTEIISEDNPYMLSEVSTSKTLKYFAEFFTIYPQLVIQDRLNNTDSLWNISMPMDGHNSKGVETGMKIKPEAIEPMKQYFLKEDWATTNSNEYIRNTFYTEFLQMSVTASSNIPLIDALLWRNGIYLCLAMILIAYAIIKKITAIIFMILTLLSIWGSMFLVMDFHIYHYVWFFVISTIMCLLYALYPTQCE